MDDFLVKLTMYAGLWIASYVFLDRFPIFYGSYTFFFIDRFYFL